MPKRECYICGKKKTRGYKIYKGKAFCSLKHLARYKKTLGYLYK
jgi:ribosomal protein L28